jgi:hypothetical protein
MFSLGWGNDERSKKRLFYGQDYSNGKEGSMERKVLIGLMALVIGISVFGCAGLKPTPDKIASIKVSLDTVERLNAIAAKPPYQGTDVLVFRINFRLTNPNHVLAKVDNLYFETKIDDGTREKMVVLAGSMPSLFIPAGGEVTWSYADPLLYGGLFGQIITRGLGGEAGMKGAAEKREQIWQGLGADKMKFFVDGNITSSLPDFPNLGSVYNQFSMEFAVPGL